MMLLTGSRVKGVEMDGVSQAVALERQRGLLEDARNRRLVAEARRGRPERPGTGAGDTIQRRWRRARTAAEASC